MNLLPTTRDQNIPSIPRKRSHLLVQFAPRFLSDDSNDLTQPNDPSGKLLRY